MIALSVAQIAEIVQGRLAGGAQAEAVVTQPAEFDSRAVGQGSMFVALKGERLDGHDYAAAAHAAGAVVALTSRPVSTPCVVVDDVYKALGVLARYVVDHLPQLTVIGVTGSQGKTSMKDLIAGLLSEVGPTIAPPGSFNNELGHPTTVLRATEDTQFLVLELGARGVGHIRWLTQVAPPRIGVVLNVGSAHVGKFGTVEVTAMAKGELVEALPKDGYAVLNADDERVAAMSERTNATVVSFGREPGAQVRAENEKLSAGRASFDLVTPQGRAPVQLRLVGGHQVTNALAAAAVASVLGVPISQIAAGLSKAEPRSAARMQLSNRPDGITVINDAYNANPDSMRAALRALVDVAGAGRSWAVLGYMAELGDGANTAHESIGSYAAGLGVDRLIVIGEPAAGIAAGYTKIADGSAGTSNKQRKHPRVNDDGGEVVVVPDGDSAIAVLTAAWRKGDTVLVKASNAAGLYVVAQQLVTFAASNGERQ